VTERVGFAALCAVTLALAGCGQGGNKAGTDTAGGGGTGAGGGGGQQPGGAALSGDQAKLQGKWKMVEYKLMGSDRDPSPKPVVFTGDTVDFPIIGDNLKYKLDSTASPKAIDFTLTSGPNAGQVYPGVYEFDGEKLKICYARGLDAPRPTEFVAKKLSPNNSVVLERAK
jgi:uncharacterized protein (TIGR03067 family)